MFGCQSALVSPQSRRSHLKLATCPSLPVFPHGSEWTGTCITTERVQGRGLDWGVRVGCVAFECQCCWGFDPRADQHRCSQRGHERNQGTTRQMILQYSRCERAGARWSPRFTCLYGEGDGCLVDEASLSSRHDHHRDHRAGPPVVCPGLFPSSARLARWMDVHQDWVSRSDQGRAAARTKIDEDEMKAGGRALPVPVSSQNLSALVHFGNRCYERQKEGFCPKPPWQEGWWVDTQHWLEPCSGHARNHATSGMRHKSYPISHAIPCPASGCFLTGRA